MVEKISLRERGMSAAAFSDRNGQKPGSSQSESWSLLSLCKYSASCPWVSLTLQPTQYIWLDFFFFLLRISISYETLTSLPSIAPVAKNISSNLYFLFFLSFLGPHHGIWKLNRSFCCWPTPQPQQRGIRAVSVTYTIAHGSTEPLTHWVRPGIRPTSLWILVRFVTTEPQWELKSVLSNEIHWENLSKFWLIVDTVWLGYVSTLAGFNIKMDWNKSTLFGRNFLSPYFFGYVGRLDNFLQRYSSPNPWNLWLLPYMTKRTGRCD